MAGGLLGQGSLTAYNPTFREKVTDALRGLLFSDDREGQRKAERLSNVLEFTPYGVATAVDDVKEAVGQGDYASAGLLGAMAMVPGPSLKHGSPIKGLNELRPSRRGPLGPGVYTSPDTRVASFYARDDGVVYSMPPRQYDVYTGAGHKTDEEWTGFKNDKERLAAASEQFAPDKAEEIKAVLGKMWSGDGYPLFQRIRVILGSEDRAQALFRAAGFDGISGQVDGPETLLFDAQRLGND